MRACTRARKGCLRSVSVSHLAAALCRQLCCQWRACVHVYLRACTVTIGERRTCVTLHMCVNGVLCECVCVCVCAMNSRLRSISMPGLATAHRCRIAQQCNGQILRSSTNMTSAVLSTTMWSSSTARKAKKGSLEITCWRSNTAQFSLIFRSFRLFVCPMPQIPPCTLSLIGLTPFEVIAGQANPPHVLIFRYICLVGVKMGVVLGFCSQ